MNKPVIARTGFGRTLILVKYLLVYFARVVIGRGALRKPIVRNSLAILILLLGVFLVTFVARYMISGIDIAYTDYLFAIFAPEVILGAIIGLIVVKFLVGNAANIAAVLDYLPVARYEKGRAYAIVELLLIFTITFLTVIVFLGASFINYGFAIFGLFVSCFFLPATTTIFIGVIVSRILEFLLSHTPLKIFAASIISVIFCAMAILLYNYANSSIYMISMSEVGREYPWYLLYYYLYDNLNSILFYVFALIIAIALVSLLLLLPTPIPAKRTIYTSFSLGNLVTRLPFGVNLAQFIRHRVFVEEIILCVIIAIYVGLSQDNWSLTLAMEPLVFVGMYHFANINAFIFTTRPYLSNISYYLSMLSGLLSVILVPIVCLSLMDLLRVLVFHHSITFATWGFTVLGVCVTAVATLSIGILLPTYDDNPFSIFLGLGVFMAVIFLVILVIGLLNLSTLMTSVIGVCCIAAIVWLSIVGIKINRKAS